MRLSNSSIGTDTEFIITHRLQPVSVVNKLGGTKERPLPIPHGALQEDNVLAEINITPAKSFEEWDSNISAVINELADRLKKQYDYHISEHASIEYPSFELLSEQAQAFGCDPDYNAWTGEMNSPPELPKGREGFRSAGGHVHVSYENVTNSRSIRLCKIIDSILGVQSVVYDRNTERRQLYGQAGAMRFKEYGVENRVLSNFWIFSTQGRRWVYDSLMVCLNIFNNNDDALVVHHEVPNIINESNIAAALTHMKHLRSNLGISVMEDY